jgi:hypothetical protein
MPFGKRAQTATVSGFPNFLCNPRWDRNNSELKGFGQHDDVAVSRCGPEPVVDGTF